jgi:hypothetical protein
MSSLGFPLLPSPILFLLQQIDIRLANIFAEDPIVGAEVAKNAPT